MNRAAAEWIEKLRLKKHPEGGYFKVTYESDLTLRIPGYKGLRRASSAIYYMLVGDQVSAFHRIKSDEVWHHYAGGTLALFKIRHGKMSKSRLGDSIGARPQIIIEKGSWLAASISSGAYCLVGCTVSPGFDYRDWELASRSKLASFYPSYKKIIESHTPTV